MTPADQPGETTGQRLYRIRLACGDGVRDPEPLDEFAKRVKRVTRRSYGAMTLSLLERMKQKWKLDDIEALSAVDPLGRGKQWLAWGDPPNVETGAPMLELKQPQRGLVPHTRPRRGRSGPR